MCTLVIVKNNQKIVATMNRDDSKSRHENPITTFNNSTLSPVDIRSGGTWIGLNRDHHIAGFLLNRYDDYTPKNKVSRGSIVLDILANGDFQSCDNFIKNDFQPTHYPPFTFLLLSNNNAIKYDWNGQKLASEIIEISDHYSLTSSSLDETAVKEYRNNAFKQWVIDGKKTYKNIPTYNLFQEKEKEDYGVFVERDKVCSLSITQITLEKDDSTIAYFDRTTINSYHDNH